MSGTVQGPQDARFPPMNDAVQKLVGVVKADPGVANVVGLHRRPGGTNSGFMFMSLKPLDKRKVSADQSHQPPAAQDERVPGAIRILTAVQDLRMGGRSAAR